MANSDVTLIQSEWGNLAKRGVLQMNTDRASQRCVRASRRCMLLLPMIVAIAGIHPVHADPRRDGGQAEGEDDHLVQIRLQTTDLAGNPIGVIRPGEDFHLVEKYLANWVPDENPFV